MNELTEGIGVLGTIRKYQEEIQEKQKLISGKDKELRFILNSTFKHILEKHDEQA